MLDSCWHEMNAMYNLTVFAQVRYLAIRYCMLCEAVASYCTSCEFVISSRTLCDRVASYSPTCDLYLATASCVTLRLVRLHFMNV